MTKNAKYHTNLQQLRTEAKIMAFLYHVVAVPEQPEGCYYFND
jgi:hypothetical protein